MASGTSIWLVWGMELKGNMDCGRIALMSTMIVFVEGETNLVSINPQSIEVGRQREPSKALFPQPWPSQQHLEHSNRSRSSGCTAQRTIAWTPELSRLASLAIQQCLKSVRVDTRSDSLGDIATVLWLVLTFLFSQWAIRRFEHEGQGTRHQPSS